MLKFIPILFIVVIGFIYMINLLHKILDTLKIESKRHNENKEQIFQRLLKESDRLRELTKPLEVIGCEYDTQYKNYGFEDGYILKIKDAQGSIHKVLGYLISDKYRMSAATSNFASIMYKIRLKNSEYQDVVVNFSKT